MDIFSAGREFVRQDARLVESRLFATVFEGADPQGVVDALRGYQNADGGFGHGLEPDKRCPDSLGLDVEVAFDTLLAAGLQASTPNPASATSGTGSTLSADASGAGSTVSAEEMVRRAVDWLASVATPDGAVALCAPAVENYPRAEHITEWTYAPGLNPTAGLVGRLYKLGIEHPWRDQAGAWCAAELAKGFPEDAHGMHESLEFLEHTENVDFDRIRDWLPKLGHFRADAADPSYGVTPLQFAPTADSFWRPLFTDAQLEAHLDRLVADQQPDGGWTITWEPPSPAATLEYRAIVTVGALRTLNSYNRL